MSRSVASTRLSAQTRSASRPSRRISSTKRSSAASASVNSPSSPSTASTIDETRFRSSGCARKAAISASSLNSKPAIRILPPNQSKPNLLCIALNRTPHIPTAEAARNGLILEGQGQARLHLKSNDPWSHGSGPVHQQLGCTQSVAWGNYQNSPTISNGEAAAVLDV